MVRTTPHRVFLKVGSMEVISDLFSPQKKDTGEKHQVLGKTEDNQLLMKILLDSQLQHGNLLEVQGQPHLKNYILTYCMLYQMNFHHANTYS